MKLHMLPLMLCAFVLAAPTALADECRDACKATYEECKSYNDSPNGEKVCGSDYHECVRQCAENS